MVGDGIVEEQLLKFPFDKAPVMVLRRREALLLEPPLEGTRKRFRDHPPLQVVHFPPSFVDMPFGHPRGVYESERIRLEWQTMPNHRQPFYHRGTGTDEMSYQVDGRRVLMTDLGSVELHPGDFTRLAEGVAHDNYGMGDIHILFYIPSPVSDRLAAYRTAELAIPPFEGWTPQVMNEQISEGLGGPGTDIAGMQIDEELLLRHAETTDERLQILRPDPTAQGTTWVYQSASVLIGRTCQASSDGRTYVRHLDVDEIQYQISGTRTLVSQRGVIDIEPGDFVSIPRGCAFTSIHAEPSAQLTLCSRHPIPQVGDTARTAVPATAQAIAQAIAQARARVQQRSSKGTE